jgi:hypothetical protein
MICPNCKSESLSRLKLQNGKPIDVELKKDKRLYSQTASIVQCPDCRDIHLLTQEYLEDGRTVFCERSYNYFKLENIYYHEVTDLILNGVDRKIEFKVINGINKQFIGLFDKHNKKIYEGDKE